MVSHSKSSIWCWLTIYYIYIYICSTQLHCHVHCFETMGGCWCSPFLFQRNPYGFCQGTKVMLSPGRVQTWHHSWAVQEWQIYPMKIGIWKTDHKSLIDWGHMMEFRWNPCLIGCKRNPFFGHKPGNWQTPLIYCNWSTSVWWEINLAWKSSPTGWAGPKLFSPSLLQIMFCCCEWIPSFVEPKLSSIPTFWMKHVQDDEGLKPPHILDDLS